MAQRIKVTITGSYLASPGSYAEGWDALSVDKLEWENGGVSLTEVTEWLEDLEVKFEYE